MNKLLLSVAILSSTLLMGCAQNEMTSIADLSEERNSRVIVRQATKTDEGLDVVETTYYAKPTEPEVVDFLKQNTKGNIDEADGYIKFTNQLTNYRDSSMQEYKDSLEEDGIEWDHKASEENIQQSIDNLSDKRQTLNISDDVLQKGYDYLDTLYAFLDEYDRVEYVKRELPEGQVKNFVDVSQKFSDIALDLEDILDEEPSISDSLGDGKFLEYIVNIGDQALDYIYEDPAFIDYAVKLKEYGPMNMYHSQEYLSDCLRLFLYDEVPDREEMFTDFDDLYQGAFGHRPYEDTKVESTPSSSSGGYKGTVKFSGGI